MRVFILFCLCNSNSEYKCEILQDVIKNGSVKRERERERERAERMAAGLCMPPSVLTITIQGDVALIILLFSVYLSY